MKLSSRVTHQPMLNSTWASNRATTGAVAALQPLTLERIRPSCFEWRTTLINPGRWLFVCDTKSSSFSFSSSKITFKSTEFKIDGGRGFCFYIYIYMWYKTRQKWATCEQRPPTTGCRVLLHWAVFQEGNTTHASLLWSLDQRGSCRLPHSLP